MPITVTVGRDIPDSGFPMLAAFKGPAAEVEKLTGENAYVSRLLGETCCPIDRMEDWEPKPWPSDAGEQQVLHALGVEIFSPSVFVVGVDSAATLRRIIEDGKEKGVAFKNESEAIMAAQRLMFRSRPLSHPNDAQIKR